MEQQPYTEAQRQHARTSSNTPLTATLIAPVQRWYAEMRWTSERPRASPRKRWAIILSYAPDWIITIVLAAVITIVLSMIDGFRREFSLTDASIQHTYAVKERVSTTLLAVLAVLIPAAIIAIVSLGISRSVWDLNAGLLGFVLSHAITLTATTVVKVTVGRPRPDLIDRCQPRPGSANATPYGLVTQAICTTDLGSHLLRDGFRSFPSGHASTAFAGFTFLSLYLAGKMHIFHPARGHAAYEWIIFFPMIAAALIAISRSMDYRHHWSDLLAGALLGTFISLMTYHIYYPNLTYADSHKPWPPRTSKPSLHPDLVEEEVDIERTPLTPNRGSFGA
ncbi:hypothetical protein CBS101457_006213 [Exobasidium rhododendri]|nr:hypothetical protein CBS101457_006213 [Exobasidium rhododendri]